MDEREMRERLANGRVARMATVAVSGTPHVVPICYTLHGDDVFSVVDFKPKSTIDLARLENIRENPGVSLVVDHYEDDAWDRLWWVRVDGQARVVEGGVDHTLAIQLLRTKYPQYSLRRPTGAVVAIAIKRWAGWSAKEVAPRSFVRQPGRSE
jgi:PPOX class probable F420-dependent enzyme